MATNGTTEKGKTMLLFTGNIMANENRGSFLNTSMSKSNAELLHSLRHIRPAEDEDKQWQWREGSTIRLQNPDSEDELLNDENSREDVDVTVKLFYVSGAKEDANSRRRYAEDALDHVSKVLRVDKFDMLILSLPGVVLEKDEQDYKSDLFPVSEETLESWAETWKIFESLQRAGKVAALGISEFGVIRLGALLPRLQIRPAVDQINLRDCCDVPGDLLEFSKQEQIKLMPHMDEDNPLPIETLQEVLEELQVKERVTEMQWVVKYTAVVKKRGIVDNKGYIVSAKAE